MKLRAFLFVAFFVPAMAFASEMEIPCVNAACEGWRVYVDVGYSDQPAVVYAMNETGTTAYKITVTVDWYDMFDKHLGRTNYSNPGPINVQMPQAVKWSNAISRGEANITWSKEP